MKYSNKIMNTQKIKDTLIFADDIINQYRSSNKERSIAKNIPIKFLDVFYCYSKKVQSLRIRYRGSSRYYPDGFKYYRGPQDYIHKKYANSFAIYKR